MRQLSESWLNWEPFLNEYMFKPMFKYLVEPFRSLVATPISTFANRISRYMGTESEEVGANRQIR